MNFLFGLCRFAQPYLAFLMFVPSSLVGLLIPRTIWRFFPISQDTSFLGVSKEAMFDEACFWEAFGLYGFTSMAYLLAGLGGGFLTFFISASMILAWFSFCLTRKRQQESGVTPSPAGWF